MTKTKNLGKISELIFQAVEMGNVTELKTLIENEVNIKMKNEYGWTLLHVASMKGNLEVVKCLLESRLCPKSSESKKSANEEFRLCPSPTVEFFLLG